MRINIRQVGGVAPPQAPEFCGAGGGGGGRRPAGRPGGGGGAEPPFKHETRARIVKQEQHAYTTTTSVRPSPPKKKRCVHLLRAAWDDQVLQFCVKPEPRPCIQRPTVASSGLDSVLSVSVSLPCVAQKRFVLLCFVPVLASHHLKTKEGDSVTTLDGMLREGVAFQRVKFLSSRARHLAHKVPPGA